METMDLWGRFKQRFFYDPSSGFSLDTSRINYEDAYLKAMEPKLQSAFEEMARLEAGEVANRSERRASDAHN